MKRVAEYFLTAVAYVVLALLFLLLWATFPAWFLWAMLHESEEPHLRQLGGWY